MGSWLTYGLGSESDDLPGFVVLTSDGHFGQAQPIASRQWHSGFLPSRFQGVRFYSKGDSVLYMGNPGGVDRNRQRDVVDAVRALDSIEEEVSADPEIATRIAAYETAFRMQTSVPELIDFRNEPKHILDLYGAQGVDGSFGANCLLARRLAERGVRFIQLYHRDWDHHGAVKQHSQGTAAEVDQGAAALVKDLKQRGMLDETLVVWGGEFGRTPMAQGDGRDHHIKGFSIWMAGGGIKGGITHGATDELGYGAVQGRRARARPARDDSGSLRHRPPAAGLPIPGARFPVDRRGGPGGAGRSWRESCEDKLSLFRACQPGTGSVWTSVSVPCFPSKRRIVGGVARRGRSGALAAGSIGGSCSAARIHISGGQHSQQGRTAAGTTRVSTAAHSGDSSGPLKPIMQRCVFLRFRFVHRTRPPQVETRPKQQVYAPPFHWAERNPNSTRQGRPGIVRQPDPPEDRPVDSADHLAKKLGSVEAQSRENTPKSAIGTIARSRFTIAKPSLYVIG